jgi:hypothetical protein
MSDLTWQKSSFSSGSGSGECVELASCGEAVCLRESDDPVVELAACPTRLGALLVSVKIGRFDRLV